MLQSKKLLAVTCLVALASSVAMAQESNGPGPGPRGQGPGCDFIPAPASIGTDIGLGYFGPPPSESNPSLIGPLQLLRSGTVDDIRGRVTIPLYKGHLKDTNETVWYILTDTSDKAQSEALGLNHSPKLQFAGPGTRTARLNADGTLVFDSGKVDFAPDRIVQPGPAGAWFPPARSQPGSVGDADYSPIVRITNAGNVVYNAPIVAFGVEASQLRSAGAVNHDVLHDEVLAIDPAAMTVTMNLVNGFSFGRPVWYLSMDASDPAVAGVEGATYAPKLNRIDTGNDDSFASAVERIFIAVNGPYKEGCANPQRQGLYAALRDGHRPNNVFGGIPTIATDYSPLWNAQFYQWTEDAIRRGFRSQLREEFQILGLVQDGFLTGPGGAPFEDVGVIINCPPVQRLL